MDIEGPGADIPSEGAVSISSLPKTALQAIYHAATGKTESLTKDITGNVVINVGDIDRLFEMFE